jgi:hypothetical protein
VNIPSKLYKYQSCDEYALNNLKQKQLWFSKPEKFNDPFDCDINFNITDISDENIGKLFVFFLESSPDTTAFNEKYSKEGKFNTRFRDDVVTFAIAATNIVKARQWKKRGIACFSENNDNILMWSHYANGHQGFCLEFDTNFAPFKQIDKRTLLQVNYPRSNSYPDLSLNDIPHQLPLFVETQLGTKSLFWSYEHEWRIFADEGNKAYTFEEGALIAVYLGSKMKNEDKTIIQTTLADSSIRIFQMEKSRTEFKVISRDL